MMVISNEFELGQIVFLRTDKDQLPRIVVRFQVWKEAVRYVLAQGTYETTHDAMEISATEDVLIKT